MLQQLERASRAGTDNDYEIVYPFQVEYLPHFTEQPHYLAGA